MVCNLNFNLLVCDCYLNFLEAEKYYESNKYIEHKIDINNLI